MVIESAAWERRLLSWAHEALISPALDHPLEVNLEALARAYDYAARLTQAHSRTFYLAAGLLPKDKRRAAHALYAFCRWTDDLVDKAQDQVQGRQALAAWRGQLGAARPRAGDPVLLAWADTQARYRIPHGYADQLVAGVARDLAHTRYASFTELAEYCYGVASTVGLMTMHIVGYAGREAVPYAVRLGIALQLTNILRDVGEDWRAGRLYLPLDELAAFGLDESDIAAGHVDDRWRAFMRFQIARVERLYDEAAPGVALLNADGRFAIAAAAALYRAILADIAAHDYDVFRRRAHVGLAGKLRRLPGIWRQSQTARIAPARQS